MRLQGESRSPPLLATGPGAEAEVEGSRLSCVWGEKLLTLRLPEGARSIRPWSIRRCSIRPAQFIVAQFVPKSIRRLAICPQVNSSLGNLSPMKTLGCLTVLFIISSYYFPILDC